MGVVISRTEPLQLTLPPELVEEIVHQVAELVLERLDQERDEWMDSTQAAAYLGITRGHLHNLRGTVPSHKVGGRQRYRRSELDGYQDCQGS